MNELVPKRSRPPAENAPTRRRLLASLPAAVASATALPHAADAGEAGTADTADAKNYDGEHIRRFYELARF